MRIEKPRFSDATGRTTECITYVFISYRKQTSWKLLCDAEGAACVLLESDRGGKRNVICPERQDDCLLNVYK